MKLNVPVYSSKFFSYHKETNTLVAEHSDMNNAPILNRIYDDACDVGFKIRSERTGVEKLFYFTHVDKDGEGDVAGWNFECNDGEFKALVIND